MIQGRAESLKVATSLLAVANTPLFVPTELKQKSVVKQLAISIKLSALQKLLENRISTPPKSLSEEASAYLFMTLLSLKGEVGVLMSLRGKDAIGYRWFKPVIEYLCASTSHQNVGSFVAQPGSGFQSNIVLGSSVPSNFSLHKDEQA